jgi:hypothetical protein
MMDSSVATYGEENRLWTGDEARAYARIAAIPALLAARAGDWKEVRDRIARASSAASLVVVASTPSR